MERACFIRKNYSIMKIYKLYKVENFEFIKNMVISGGTKVSLHPSELLFRTGDKAENVFFINKGMLVINDSGANKYFKANVNTFLGIREVLMDELYVKSAIALGETEIISISKLKFMSYIFGNAKVRNFFIKYMSQELPVYEKAFE